MPVRDRWCHHVPAATAEVICGGERHRVSWRRGKLKFEDHDLSAERAMLAFGGETPECLQVLTLWRNVHSWAMSGELLQHMQSRLGPEVLLAPGDLRRVSDLSLLLTWEREWRRRRYFSDHGRILAEQLRQRAMPPLRDHLKYWMARHGSRRLSKVELELGRHNQPAVVRGHMDSVGVRASATLGVQWLVQVWARGLEVVDGALVLEVVEEQVHGTPEVARVRAVRWERQGAGVFPVAATALVQRLPAGEWRLEWEDQP
ncbi:MAG TPA: hypothetical protein VFJ85_07375 [Acidimicrobiales bacterium]|nr:hypothetical protein [Acidimicrobiales bacterium]